MDRQPFAPRSDRCCRRAGRNEHRHDDSKASDKRGEPGGSSPSQAQVKNRTACARGPSPKFAGRYTKPHVRSRADPSWAGRVPLAERRSRSRRAQSRRFEARRRPRVIPVGPPPTPPPPPLGLPGPGSARLALVRAIGSVARPLCVQRGSHERGPPPTPRGSKPLLRLRPRRGPGPPKLHGQLLASSRCSV